MLSQNVFVFQHLKKLKSRFFTAGFFYDVTLSGQAIRYIFFAEKAKKDAAAILNALIR